MHSGTLAQLWPSLVAEVKQGTKLPSTCKFLFQKPLQMNTHVMVQVEAQMGR